MTSGTDSVSSRPSKSTSRTGRDRWKAVERRIARLLGGERVPVSGRARGHKPDAGGMDGKPHPWLSIEIKSRKSQLVIIQEMMDQARKAEVVLRRHDGIERLPIGVYHVTGTHANNALVFMRLGDFLDRFGDGRMADIEVAE